jgi:hypothetical protein
LLLQNRNTQNSAPDTKTVLTEESTTTEAAAKIVATIGTKNDEVVIAVTMMMMVGVVNMTTAIETEVSMMIAATSEEGINYGKVENGRENIL